jgi:hypothetical protein
LEEFTASILSLRIYTLGIILSDTTRLIGNGILVIEATFFASYVVNFFDGIHTLC